MTALQAEQAEDDAHQLLVEGRVVEAVGVDEDADHLEVHRPGGRPVHRGDPRERPR